VQHSVNHAEALNLHFCSIEFLMQSFLRHWHLWQYDNQLWFTVILLCQQRLWKLHAVNSAYKCTKIVFINLWADWLFYLLYWHAWQD
jgi:hypothetical protein